MKYSITPIKRFSRNKSATSYSVRLPTLVFSCADKPTAIAHIKEYNRAINKALATVAKGRTAPFEITEVELTYLLTQGAATLPHSNHVGTQKAETSSMEKLVLHAVLNDVGVAVLSRTLGGGSIICTS